WDFLPKGDTGRLRTSVLGDLGIEGKKSLSLDAWKPVEEQENRLVGTFNLSNYRIDQHELRIEFDFLLHGGSKFPQDNGLWIRGSDRDPWKPAMDFPWDHTGAVLNSGTLSLNDLLEGQSFSSSFQLMFVQKDSSLIAENHFGTGLSIDNWKLFEVFDDLHLLSISSPQPFYCGTKQPVPVIVQLHNGVYNDLHNIRLFYQLNDDPPIEEMLSFLGAKQTMDFSFDKPVLLKPGENRLRVWSAMETDSYPGNDSLEMPQIFNQPLIQHYPYFQGFEADGGSWYAGGRNRS